MPVVGWIGNFQQTPKQQTYFKLPLKLVSRRQQQQQQYTRLRQGKQTNPNQSTTPRASRMLCRRRRRVVYVSISVSKPYNERPTARKFRLNEIPTRRKKKKYTSKTTGYSSAIVTPQTLPHLLCSQKTRALKALSAFVRLETRTPSRGYRFLQTR